MADVYNLELSSKAGGSKGQYQLDKVVHTLNPREAEAGGSLQAGGHSGLQSEFQDS